MSKVFKRKITNKLKNFEIKAYISNHNIEKIYVCKDFSFSSQLIEFIQQNSLSTGIYFIDQVANKAFFHNEAYLDSLSR